MNIKFVFIPIVYLTFTYAVSNGRYGKERLLSKPYAEELQHQIDKCKFGICENYPSYPSDEIHKIVDLHQVLHSFFKGNVFKTIGTRSGSNEESFCKSRDVRVIPRAMKDIENITRVIVDVKDHPQILTFQVCENEESECFGEAPWNFKTKCEQRYNNINLLTFNVTNNVPEFRTFKVPTTCVCTYKKNSN